LAEWTDIANYQFGIGILLGLEFRDSDLWVRFGIWILGLGFGI